MHRLLIKMVMMLCFVFGLMAHAFANDYCPTLTIRAGQIAICQLWNYGTLNDTNVTINVYYYGIASTTDEIMSTHETMSTEETTGSYSTTASAATEVMTCGPLTVPKGGHAECFGVAPLSGYWSCKVTGEASLTRTSLLVHEHPSGYVLVALPCD
jgi:hypothetical protein